ncbi:hypothetical protein EV121DRAFT_284716 [Schizophyllum commune]
MKAPIPILRRSGAHLARSSRVHIPITEAPRLFPTAAAAVITTATTELYLVDFLRHLVGLMRALRNGLLVGPRKIFDMYEHRGDNLIGVVGSDVILADHGGLCCQFPIIHKVALQAITCNAVLNALAKVINIFQGVVDYKEAADLLEAILGKLDQVLGHARARALVTELLRPLVKSAVMACYAQLSARYADRSSRIPPTLSPSIKSFTLAFDRLPVERAVDRHLHLHAKPHRRLAGPPSATPLEHSTALSSDAYPHNNEAIDARSRGTKRGRDDDAMADAGAQEEGMNEHSQLLSSNAVLQTQPHRKKRKVGASTENKENEPLEAVPPINATVQTPVPSWASHDPICRALQALPPGAIVFDLPCASDSIYPAAIDESVGENLVHYILMAAFTDDWADEGMSSYAAKEAVMAMISMETVDYIARVLEIRGTFFRMVARASREHPHRVIRQTVLAIYVHVLPVALAIARPSYDHFQPHSLEHTRKHLTDVLRLREAGHVHQPNVHPMHAVLATNRFTIEHIFDRRFLRILRLL